MESKQQVCDSAAAVQDTGGAQAIEECASAQCSNSASPALAATDLALKEEFVPATSFTSAMDGFVFTTGNCSVCAVMQLQGLGPSIRAELR